MGWEGERAPTSPCKPLGLWLLLELLHLWLLVQFLACNPKTTSGAALTLLTHHQHPS